MENDSCINCKNHLSIEDLFCKICGTRSIKEKKVALRHQSDGYETRPHVVAKTKVLSCTCGAAIQVGNSFCPECGEVQGNNSTQMIPVKDSTYKDADVERKCIGCERENVLPGGYCPTCSGERIKSKVKNLQTNKVVKEKKGSIIDKYTGFILTKKKSETGDYIFTDVEKVKVGNVILSAIILLCFLCIVPTGAYTFFMDTFNGEEELVQQIILTEITPFYDLVLIPILIGTVFLAFVYTMSLLLVKKSVKNFPWKQPLQLFGYFLGLPVVYSVFIYTVNSQNMDVYDQLDLVFATFQYILILFGVWFIYAFNSKPSILRAIFWFVIGVVTFLMLMSLQYAYVIMIIDNLREIQVSNLIEAVSYRK